MDDLVIPSSNIDDLGGEALGCTNNIARVKVPNYKMSPFA